MLRLIVRLIVRLLLLVRLLITLSSLSNRPLRQRLISRLRAVFRFLAARRSFSKLEYFDLFYWADHVELQLLCDTRAPWSQMQPVIARVPDAKYHARAARIAANLYFAEGRFDEAKAAIRYGCQAIENWVQEHREEARADMQLVHEMRAWRAAQRRGEETPESRWGSNLWKASIDNTRLSLTGAGLYRDLHFTLSVLEWSEAQGDAQIHQIGAAMSGNTFMIFRGTHFEQQLAKSIGMDEATLERIQVEAESV